MKNWNKKKIKKILFTGLVIVKPYYCGNEFSFNAYINKGKNERIFFTAALSDNSPFSLKAGKKGKAKKMK